MHFPASRNGTTEGKCDEVAQRSHLKSLDLRRGSSPDLNYNKILWSILKKQLDQQKITHYQLWELVQQEWISNDQDLAFLADI